MEEVCAEAATADIARLVAILLQDAGLCRVRPLTACGRANSHGLSFAGWVQNLPPSPWTWWPREGPFFRRASAVGGCLRRLFLRRDFLSLASLSYRSVITSPLRSAATINPAWRPARVSIAPFWLVSTIPPAPAPTATPAPAAP